MIRTARRKRPTPTTPPPELWWGEGAPPWERWPGVSLRLDATWSAERSRWESPCGRFHFDPARGARPREFFSRYLRHSTGHFAGQPFELLSWQELLIFRPLWGWLREDGTRRFRNVFVEVAKKNGKSAIASGVGLLLATADDEPGAQVYAAAGDEQQARIVFDESSTMANASPEYLEDAGVEVLASSIVQERTNSFFKVLTSKAATKHGFNVHGLIFDELHAQKARDLYETLAKGTSARRQPIILKVTTAGDNRESIGYEEYEYACKVRDGLIDDAQHLPVIFEAKPDDDWTSEATWRKANPSLGVTKFVSYMEAECKAAQAEPRKRNDFLRLDLNIWTESRSVWITPEAWAACKRDGPPPADLRELVWCGGLDLSATKDLTAFVCVFRRHEAREALAVDVDALDTKTGEIVQRRVNVNYQIEIEPHFWLPDKILHERARKDRVPYDAWARDGWLHVTKGGMIDQDEIADYVRNIIRPKYPRCAEIGFDRWSALPIVGRMRDEGAPMIEVGQGTGGVSAACKLFEALVSDGRVIHDGNPVMAWCVANTEIYTNSAGDIKPQKPDGEARGTRRIDGVAATVTALARLMQAPEQRSAYSASRGIAFIG